MRIWSIHPQYLDSKGLVALWRETLLAKKVLENQTTGYRNHPQLERFNKSGNLLENINFYLSIVYQEAIVRQYKFDSNKFKLPETSFSMNVTQGQLTYEFSHLLKKLKIRDVERYNHLKDIEIVRPHPLFQVIKGEIEEWEIIRL